MSSTQVGAVLRHIRKLATVRKDHERPDHELLERFAGHRDEAAFAALLRRHGPMVLGVCRSVLHDLHDAEDAFQAAFLLLSQKAASIHRREAVSGWLYRVAYHAAVRAKANAARRRILEKRAVIMPSADPVLDLSLREVRAVLFEELERLPEEYRRPLVLCGLEEKTLEEAARLLGWTKWAVKGRLQRGRELLRARLQRRGLEFPAVLATTALALNSASGQVPGALTETTLRAAVTVAASGGVIGGAVSAEVAALVKGASKAMFRSKVKAVLVLVFALGMAVVGFAAARHGAFAAPPEDAREVEQPKGKDANRPAPAEPKESDESVAVSGQVLDPEGKPCAGAKLSLATHGPSGFKVEERATSAEDGSFRFTMPKTQFDRSFVLPSWEQSRLMATAKGYGPDAIEFHKSDKYDGVTLRLVKDHPLSGRILDQDGKPVTGAKVRVVGLSAYRNDKDLDALLDAVRTAAYLGDIGTGTGVAGNYWIGPVPGQPAEVTTGADGRFRLAGLGQERHVRLQIAGSTIQHGYLEAVTRPMEPLVGPSTSVGVVKLFGATFDYAAAPARPIRGVVRDKATGKPVAGIAVSGNTTYVSHTDKEGRYELLGCPKSSKYGVTATPAPGQMYFAKTVELADTPGFEPLTADLELPTGIPLQGHVTDAATMKPVAGATVAYYPLLPNPFATHLTYNPVTAPCSAITTADGSFQLPVLAGPGVLAVKCPPGHPYMPALLTTREIEEFFKGKDIHKRSNDRVFWVQQGAGGASLIAQDQHQAILLMDPEEKTTSLKKEVTVQPGRTIKGTVVDSDGKPLKGATLNGASLPDGSFTLTHLNPRRTSGLYFVHREKGLGLFKEIPADEDKPLTVQLQACGSVTGRIVDKDGQPVANVLVRLGYVADVKTDKDGRFRVDGLVVGAKYRVEGADRVRHPAFYDSIRIEPGKVKDLGDATLRGDD